MQRNKYNQDMKRIIPILLCVFITTGAGYNGTLPNIEAEFAYKKTAPETSAPPFTPNEKADNSDLKPIPRDNKSYLEIIIKKDKSSQYLNDTNNIILILEKLQRCIRQKQDIQKFNAIISNLIDNIELIKTQYQGKPEGNYISYKNLMALSVQARNVAVLRTESLVYTKYLPYSSSGAVYKPQNVEKQVNNLLRSVDQTLYVLKNLD